MVGCGLVLFAVGIVVPEVWNDLVAFLFLWAIKNKSATLPHI